MALRKIYCIQFELKKAGKSNFISMARKCTIKLSPEDGRKK